MLEQSTIDWEYFCVTNFPLNGFCYGKISYHESAYKKFLNLEINSLHTAHN